MAFLRVEFAIAVEAVFSIIYELGKYLDGFCFFVPPAVYSESTIPLVVKHKIIDSDVGRQQWITVVFTDSDMSVNFSSEGDSTLFAPAKESVHPEVAKLKIEPVSFLLVKGSV